MRMFKKVIVGLLFSFFVMIAKPVFSQTTNIDSIKLMLLSTKADTFNILPMVTVGMKMPNKDYDAKMLVYNWVIQQSEKINYPVGVVWGYRSIAILNRDLFNSKEAIENMLKSIEIAEKYKLYRLQALGLDGIAGIYRYNKSFDRAIEYNRKAITVYEKYGGDKLGMGVLYYNLGSNLHDSVPVKRRTNDNPDVIYNLRKGIQIAEDAKDNFVLLQLLNGTSVIYSEKEQFDTALMYINKVELLIKELKVPRYYNSFYLRKGDIYSDKHELSQALYYYKTGLDLVKKNKDPFYERDYLSRFKKTLAAIGDTISAYKYAIAYNNINDSLGNEEKLKTTALIDGRFQKEKKDNEIKQLKAQEVIQSLEAKKREGEINLLQIQEKLTQLEIEKQKAIIAGNILETQKKADEIKLLEQQKKLQQLEIAKQEEELEKKILQAKADSQQIKLAEQGSLIKQRKINTQQTTRNYLLGGLGILALLSFILFRNITAKKKAYTALQDKSEQIREQALQLSKQAKQIAQFQSQMNPHFVYNALHNIQGLVLTEDKQKANTQIQSLAQLMRKTFANAEKDDIPVEEEVNYLKKYIEFEKAAFGNNLSFEVDVTKEAEGTLLPPMMIQPFIENAIKHAELKSIINPHIKVLIEIENNLIAIHIKDNGTGIKKNINEPDKLSHSMSVIKSRLDLIFKGNANISNQPILSIKSIPEIAQGTSIKFYLPLNYAY